MVFNYIKRAVLTYVGKDNDEFSIGQASYNNKTGDVEMVWPYGMSANPPAGSLMLLFNVMGQEENRAAIVSYPQMRFTGLSEGELKMGNFVTGANIYWDKDGKIFIDAPDNHIVIKSGKTVRIQADRIELAAKESIKWDVGGRGYTYYADHTDSWQECTQPGSSNPCQAPEHNDGIPPAK